MREKCRGLILNFLMILILLHPNFAISDKNDEFLIIGDESTYLYHGDYSPPPPEPPSLPPLPPPASCEGDLKGFGSLDKVCRVNSSVELSNDVYIQGNGSLEIVDGVNLICPISACLITVNLSGDFHLGRNSYVRAGAVWVKASSAILFEGSVVNVSGMGGKFTPHATGTPSKMEGSGGGHGGRGATCLYDGNDDLEENDWGGDAFAWSELSEPWSFGSRGGTTSRDVDFGGEGGGRIWFNLTDSIDLSGSLLADGGNAGAKGGGGAGGSVFIQAPKMIGNGWVTASGGDGLGGGGGGRVSISIFSRHGDQEFLVHGGRSFGCPHNSGAAGTFYDAVPRRLIIDNYNFSTDTSTLLLEFPNHPLWTNVYIQNQAKATVPLLWSRVQVQGQLSLSAGAALTFGLPHFATSAFELIAEELLMSDSRIKIHGALRMTVKMHLMLNSKILIDGNGDAIVTTSLLEISNLLVLKKSSVIHSTGNMGIHGQGYMNLSGPGNIVEAQRLVLSLFYSVNVGPKSILRGPLDDASTHNVTPHLYCDDRNCPVEMLHPPEDCNVNSSLPFTLQVCRVEDVVIEGFAEGSVIHFHWVRSVVISTTGVVTASGLGCVGGVGQGNLISNGLGGGGGHGGKGGDGYYGGSFASGGGAFGNADLPCELGSGSGNKSLAGSTAGGGIIVMGSLEHSLPSLSIYGLILADGQSYDEQIRKVDTGALSNIGPGGGSGGTILLFVHNLTLGNSSALSAVGGTGSPYGGGGGGGRVHFHWSDIPVGDEYQPIASVTGNILVRGGLARSQGNPGEVGTITGKACPEGLHGIFCKECPVGTFKNVSGSDTTLCHSCPAYELPARGMFIGVRGGVTELPCPYKCISDRYHMPHCWTTLEELMYTFGGPLWFGFFLSSLLILLALVLSVARMKFASGDELPGLLPPRRRTQLDHSFPFLESLNEVLETNRNEEALSHVHRMYFLGPNTFSDPWHLPHSPPDQVVEIVYEDAFIRFVDEINGVASYQWWEGSVYSILSVMTYPLAWSWLQWRRRKKLQRLREFVRSEYDHSCLRSCRSRALYEGLKLSATSDLMLAFLDFYLGGDEKRSDLPPRLHQRLPVTLIFGGDGSYMAPFTLHNDSVLTSLISQSVPSTLWYRFVAGLNAQLRLVHRGQLKMTFKCIVEWLESLANPALSAHDLRVDLGWFQQTACGYSQFGLVVRQARTIRATVGSLDGYPALKTSSRFRRSEQLDHLVDNEQILMNKTISGFILQDKDLHILKDGNNICNLFNFILRNTKPTGHQDLIGLALSILLLGDFSLAVLTLIELYSMSLLVFFLVLFILPLGVLLPFPAGINALFSKGPRKSAGLARIHGLWNITSLINVITALICGFVHYKTQRSNRPMGVIHSLKFSREENEWWLLPSSLLICKLLEARFIDYHIANQEISDLTLYSKDPDLLWHS